MTREEALEYLNLPRKSSAQLVKKRYQELQQDYQKAITNAPSQHFRDLYSENLDKIEEAYLLMKSQEEQSKAQQPSVQQPQVQQPQAQPTKAKVSTEKRPSVIPHVTLQATASDGAMQQKLWEIQTLIDTFSTHNELTGKRLNQQSKAEIERYINQIENWQKAISTEDQDTPKPVDLPLPQAASVALAPNLKEPIVDAEPLLNENPVQDNVQDVAPPSPEELAPAVDNTIESGTELAPPNQPAPAVVQQTNVKPAIKIPKEKPRSQVQSTISSRSLKSKNQWVGQLLKEQSAAQRAQSFNKLVTVAILTVLLTGIGGITYLIYPLLKAELNPAGNTVVEDTNEDTPDDTPQIAIAQIVGDEFFRTGNYLEAIVQYTLAFADDPLNHYLKQRIDSCKVLLSQAEEVRVPDATSTVTTPARQASVQEQPPVNTANRFRGDENLQPKEFAWSNWAQDPKVNEQVINSARSALLDSSIPSSSDSAEFEAPKTSGKQNEELENPNAIRSFVDAKPEPKGGWEDFKKFTSKRIRFPQEAYRAKVSGIVLVQFVVGKDGNISDAKVVQGIGYGCDQEALRIVKAYKGWTPGILEGQPVNTRAVIPIHFKLAN